MIELCIHARADGSGEARGKDWGEESKHVVGTERTDINTASRTSII